jgi:endonuclease G
MHKDNSSDKTDRKPRDTSGDFTEYPNDPDLPSQYHFTSDPYWGSGYDHGHIIASADRAYSYNRTANIQTFYMTNMQPQVNGFNAYVWSNMEKRVRSWNTYSFRDTLYVCKGGTIDDTANIIRYLGSGKNKIPVPKYFFMALLCKNKDGYKALGFWVEHKANDDSNLAKYVVNIDELERKTGLDFFCNLPDEVEKRVESLPVVNVKTAWGF